MQVSGQGNRKPPTAAPNPCNSCFVAGTPVLTMRGLFAIEAVLCGEDVVTFVGRERERSGARRAVLRLIRLTLDRPDGGRVEIALLRSPNWIADYGAHVGGSVWLDMKEMGVTGLANVDAIGPARVFIVRPGLVTGTFRHTSGEVYDLWLESESKPIGVTGAHPFWSLDRNAWVSVIDLHLGETLATLTGTTVVERIEKGEHPQPVHNIEVEGDHAYRVGESGVLVHNASLPNPCSKPSDSKLRSDVIHIHSAFAQVHFLAKTLRTTALGVLQDRDGKYYCVYSVSSNNLDDPVSERAKERGYSYVSGSDHAEKNILAFAKEYCLKVVAIAPCRPACGPAKQNCEAAVKESGAKLINPLPNSAGQTDRCKYPED